MKQKTPLLDAIDKLKLQLTEDKKFVSDYEKDSSKYYHSDYLRAMDAIEVREEDIKFLTELLPKEKEVIVESLKFYMNTDGIGNADGLAEVHFNETFTQK